MSGLPEVITIYKSYRASTIAEFAEALQKQPKGFELFYVNPYEHAGKQGYEFIIKTEEQ